MNLMHWFAILVGLLVAIVGVRKGFFAMWGTIFNVLISIYLGIMLTPLIVGTFQEEGVSCYCCAGCVVGISILTFTILQSFVYCFYFKVSKVILPRVVDTIGAGILGFICGYIVCSFFVLAIGIMPAIESPFSKNFFNREKLLTVGKGPVVKSCNFVGGMSLQFRKGVAFEVVEQLTMPTEDQIYDPRRRYIPYSDGDQAYDLDEIADEEAL